MNGYNIPMALLLGVLFALQADAEKAAAGIRMPEEKILKEWAAKGERQKRIIDLITDRRHWVEAIKLIDGKLGLFAGACEVEVTIEESPGPKPAHGKGEGGKGVVRFNMRKLVEYLARLDEYKELERGGKVLKWVIPPMKMEAIIHHELAHVFCGTFDDKWVTEGIASYVAAETTLVYSFNHRGGRVEGLDKPLPEADSYARGMAFFMWLEAIHGRDKVRAFADRIANRKESPAVAAAAVTGMSWDRLVLEERSWSAAWIARFKAP